MRSELVCIVYHVKAFTYEYATNFMQFGKIFFTNDLLKRDSNMLLKRKKSM